MAKDDGAAIVVGVIALGLILLAAIAGKKEEVPRCPVCNLVLFKDQTPCPRCHTPLRWQ
jgi:uncharacterized paraquat-inducible protein A